MRKTHKAQHWIPRSYLSSWIDPDTPQGFTPYVYLIPKDGAGVQRRAPANIFTETDLYTIALPDGSRDLRLEHGLCDLENAFAAMRRDFLSQRRSIPFLRRMKFLMFTAAMHARTPAMRNHHAKFWNEVREMGEQLEADMRGDPSTRPKIMSSMHSSGRQGIGMEEVRKMASNTMQHMLLPFISAETPLLAQMRCLVLCTRNDPGFITSDNPVVWFNPDWQNKPPMFQSPSFSDPELEITFPVSPNQLLMFTHGEPSLSYHDVPDAIVSEVNRRTRFSCNEYFVVRRAYLEPYWFDQCKLTGMHQH